MAGTNIDELLAARGQDGGLLPADPSAPLSPPKTQRRDTAEQPGPSHAEPMDAQTDGVAASLVPRLSDAAEDMVAGAPGPLFAGGMCSSTHQSPSPFCISICFSLEYGQVDGHQLVMKMDLERLCSMHADHF